MTGLCFQGVLTVLEFDRQLLDHPDTSCHALDSFHSVPPFPLPLIINVSLCLHTRMGHSPSNTWLLLCPQPPALGTWLNTWCVSQWFPGTALQSSHAPPLPLYKDVLGLSLRITESVHSICRRRNAPLIVSTLHQVLSIKTLFLQQKRA